MPLICSTILCGAIGYIFAQPLVKSLSRLIIRTVRAILTNAEFILSLGMKSLTLLLINISMSYHLIYLENYSEIPYTRDTLRAFLLITNLIIYVKAWYGLMRLIDHKALQAHVPVQAEAAPLPLNLGIQEAPAPVQAEAAAANGGQEDLLQNEDIPQAYPIFDKKYLIDVPKYALNAGAYGTSHYLGHAAAIHSIPLLTKPGEVLSSIFAATKVCAPSFTINAGANMVIDTALVLTGNKELGTALAQNSGALVGGAIVMSFTPLGSVGWGLFLGTQIGYFGGGALRKYYSWVTSSTE